jgi:hypothetical protein
MTELIAKPVAANRVVALRGLLAVAVMWIAILAVIWPPRVPPGMTQLAFDYLHLHQRRMTFARQAIFGPSHMLPAWYPREILGTPFWSNVQNFPFIPTRLLIVLSLDPQSPYTYATAIALAALLTSLFTYLYCRRIGIGAIGSAAAGWTFVCNGYFVSRIAAGHLSMLEAFWGLPLLLWIVESIVQRKQRNVSIAGWLFALAMSCMSLALAGHPQLPFYAMSAAAIYAIWRNGFRQSIWMFVAMALGAGCAGFAVVPMAMLIGRSTRLLPLGAALNDMDLPYRRLMTFFLPWFDGAGIPLDRYGLPAWHADYPVQYFWDTVCYAGWMPWLGIAVLLFFWKHRKNHPTHRSVSVFIIGMGLAGIVLALPFVKQIMSQIPGTFLRSPARLLYFTELSLAIALAAAIDRIIVAVPRKIAWAVVPLILIVQVIDLGWHDHYFIRNVSIFSDSETAQLNDFLRQIGDGRVAIDREAFTSANRSVDDIGFFDSITLSKPYRWLLEISGAPADLNVEMLNGSQLPAASLAATSVKAIATDKDRPDLPMLGTLRMLKIYGVPHPAARAQMFDDENVLYLEPQRLHAMLRDRQLNLAGVLLLPLGAQSAAASGGDSSLSTSVQYRRPDSDHIQCTVTASRAGFLRIIESWDPGWSATVDGTATPVIAAMDALLAVPISPGKHEVQFVYHTPGVAVGICISIVSVILLLTMAWMSRPHVDDSLGG